MKAKSIEVVEADIEVCTVYVKEACEEKEIKKRKKPGPKKRKNGRRKTFNLEAIIVEYIEKHCAENSISESEFVNRILKKGLNL